MRERSTVATAHEYHYSIDSNLLYDDALVGSPRAESDFEMIPFGPEAVLAFSRMAASLRAVARNPAARAYDALIAASAMDKNVPVYT